MLKFFDSSLNSIMQCGISNAAAHFRIMPYKLELLTTNYYWVSNLGARCADRFRIFNCNAPRQRH